MKQFALPESTPVRVVSFACRREKHGKEKVPAIDLRLGNWLMANASLLERAPSKISLWGMYDWPYVNEFDLESDAALATTKRPEGTA